jgi:hypothetical protein
MAEGEGTSRAGGEESSPNWVGQFEFRYPRLPFNDVEGGQALSDVRILNLKAPPDIRKIPVFLVVM